MEVEYPKKIQQLLISHYQQFINDLANQCLETLRRLEEEHKKAEAEAHAAEGEAAEAKASWSEARRHHETLQKKHRAVEARIRHLQSELAQQQALSAEQRQGMATACLLLADEEEIKAAVKEADSQTAGLDSVARMHMGYYDMVQQKCLATSSLSQQVLKARARVMSLKTHLKSFKHSPCMVEPLVLQIQHLKEAVQSLRQQIIQPFEAMAEEGLPNPDVGESFDQTERFPLPQTEEDDATLTETEDKQFSINELVSRVKSKSTNGTTGASFLGYATLAAGERFESLNARRKMFLLERCQALSKAQMMPRAKVNRIIKIKSVLKICVSPKSGSSSWRRLKKRLRVRRAARNRLLTVLSVRHPLSRLTSAYRDKFLGGKPISRYDASWRAETQSEQSWKYRWEAYWLPALISRGDIQPSSWLKLRRVKMLTVSDPCTQTMFSNHGLAKRMNQDYQSQMNKYIDRFKGSSFSFEDFLRHILWSRDHGILDYHWAPQTCLCDMCTKRYDFILHTESATQESKHVFAAAGSKRQLSVNNLHSTKAVSESSREVYFDRVAYRTLSEILHLYWNDFELFGYEI